MYKSVLTFGFLASSLVMLSIVPLPQFFYIKIFNKPINKWYLHTHPVRILPSLSALAISALVLGFAHEEQFVILSLAAGIVNPLLSMIVNALSVSVALIDITIL